MKKVKILTLILALSTTVSVLAGCGKANKDTAKVDPNKPVEITWWDYPNFQTGTAGDYEKKDN